MPERIGEKVLSTEALAGNDSKKVATEETLLKILGVVSGIEGYSEMQATGIDADSWTGIKKMVQNGIMKRSYPVGSRITDTWNKDENTPITAPWDVVHYDDDDNCYLKWHYSTPDGMAFDAPEAIYYAGEDGLAAGTYHITIGTAYGDGWQKDASIQFTLAETLPAGGQIFIDCGTNNKNDVTAGRPVRTYASGSDTTPIETTTTSAGTGGTSLGTIGPETVHKTNGQLNAIVRVVYGYGRWSQSAIRQWLNSEEAAGAWWAPQNGWDRPPAYAATARGFLAGYTEEFINVLDTVDVVTALNTVEGFTETTETTKDRIFLSSLQEMYAAPQLADVEGEDWDYYKTLAGEIGLPGRIPTGASNKFEELITYNASATSSAVAVWLRSAHRGLAGNAWSLYNAGYFSNYGTAYNALRACPACKILKSA